MKKKVILFLIFFISITNIFSVSNNLINSVPFASDQNVSVTEQTSYIINLVASDADGHQHR